ncbi:MAG: YIP1 family protein [candidate division KSB1 bacterium]|nr:YIP1 family protein [candidate division KSB1 bacterium]MDZ7305193.1 YIP1 family protein [candidate division KSB1 bacterium]MDZ7314288.1 YIP1 family protein [candidate division KSB1 bacterium]
MYLIKRLQNILLSPKMEWLAIKREALTVAQIYGKYLLVFAALPSAGYLLSFIGTPNFIAALRLAIISYVVWLLTFNFATVIVDLLAPTFASKRNINYAFRLVSFSLVPMLTAGLLSFIPVLGLILYVIGAAYSAYVCYYGLPVLLQTPEDKVVPYTVTTIVTVLIIYFVIMIVLGIIFGVSLRQFFSWSF